MYAFSVSILIRGPRQTVFGAITTPELVEKYFFGTKLTTDWHVGSPLTFRGEWNGQRYEDRGTVLTFDPPRHLSFNYWSSFSGSEDVTEQRQIIAYDLLEAEEGTLVTLQQSNIDTQERADHSKQNWQQVLVGLKSLVEGSN